jgi:hypothetical protein
MPRGKRGWEFSENRELLQQVNLPLCAVRCALCAVRCALCAVRCALCAVRCGLAGIGMTKHRDLPVISVVSEIIFLEVKRFRIDARCKTATSLIWIQCEPL